MENLRRYLELLAEPESKTRSFVQKLLEEDGPVEANSDGEDSPAG